MFGDSSTRTTVFPKNSCPALNPCSRGHRCATRPNQSRDDIMAFGAHPGTTSKSPSVARPRNSVRRGMTVRLCDGDPALHTIQGVHERPARIGNGHLGERLATAVRVIAESRLTCEARRGTAVHIRSVLRRIRRVQPVILVRRRRVIAGERGGGRRGVARFGGQEPRADAPAGHLVDVERCRISRAPGHTDQSGSLAVLRAVPRQNAIRCL